MEISANSFLKWVINEVVPEMAGEYFGFSALKNLLGKRRQTKEAGDSESGKTPEIKYGGLFNLSDETAFFAILGQTSLTNQKKIASFMNNKLTKDWQRRRFRVIFGSLSEMEILTKVEKTPVGIPANQENPTSTKETISEIKSNLGLKVIESFAQHSEDEMLAICQAAGILDSTFEKIKKLIDGKEGELGKKLQSATDWMKQDMEKRKASRLTTKIAGFFSR